MLLVTVAAIYDIRFRRIPNWLVGAGALLAVVLNFVLFEFEGLRASLLGLGLALLIYFPLFALRAMGAGDVKLMAAIACLMGPGPWLAIFVCSAIAGGMIAIVLLLSKKRLRTTFRNVAFLVSELAHLRPPYIRREELDVSHPGAVSLPHAVSIAAGALTYLTVLVVRGADA
ncbi:MAG TPA: prepilin peptidase [Bryobacteraceae bacterium]|nr:prepilin peptidase [Bryobacteraceae bacterium]